MKHKHHIIPRYAGGSDDKDNLVDLTPTQHSMWHYAEWLRKRDHRDLCAHKMILGDVKNPEFRSARSKAFGHIGGKAVHKKHPNLSFENGVKGNKAQRAKFEKEGRTIAEKTWSVTTPEGEQLVVTNLAKFCRENNLLKNKMCLVAKGVHQQHRGYRVAPVGISL